MTNTPLRLIHPALLPLAEPGLASADPGPTTTRVSVNSSGVQGNGTSTLSQTAGGVSADGRFVVFESDATNLVANDLNGRRDVFIRDLQLGTTSLVSANPLALPGNGDSSEPSISDDGRFIAFASEASDLVAGDTNFTTDVFVRDRVAGTTRLASVSLTGTAGNARSRNPMISADGRFVVFDSRSTDLVVGGGAFVPNIFVRDLVAGTTRRVSSAPDGSEANVNNVLPYISPDGRFVTFESFATNLGINLGGAPQPQVYLRDLQTGALELISITTTGKGASGGNFAGPISTDGHFVVFESGGGDVLPGTCCGSLYIRDRVTQTTSRINGGSAVFPHMSADARFVLFGSFSQLLPQDTNANADAYLLDRSNGQLALVSMTPSGNAGAGDSFPAAISPDGRFAAVFSSAADLVLNDTNGFQDVFLRDGGARGDFGEAFPWARGAPLFAGFSPEPVNLGTGSLTIHAQDLSLPGRVLGLDITRWYNSSDPTTGPFGPGWTHTYNWTLADRGATAELRRSDGRLDTFTQNSDGSYANPPDVFDTLAKNGDGTFTLTTTSQIRYDFSATGHLIRIAEPAGNQIALAYTTDNLSAITDPVGRVVSLTYDSQNRVMRLQDPLGRATTYGYDLNGRLTTVTDRIGNGAGAAAAHQWRYAYDGDTRHIVSITDPDGRVRVMNTYDAQGRVVQQRDGLNQLTSFTYGTAQTVMTDPRGHATTYIFDSRFRVATQTDQVGPNTYTVSYTYDSVGNRTSVTDRNGNRTDFGYDAHGNVVSKTDPSPDGISARPVTTFGYDAKNNLTQVTDALGFQTTRTYAAATNVLLSMTRQIDPSTTARTTYEYTDAANPGLPTRIVAPRGNTGATPDLTFSNALAYDSQGNLARRTDADGAISTFSYDGVGRLTSFVDPDGNAVGGVPGQHTWRLAYDELDRETSRSDPLGALMRHTYDGAGDPLSLTDRNGNVTTYGYDANTRLIAAQQRPDPLGSPGVVYTTSVTRDANGNTTRIVQANAVAADYGYDALDRLISITTHPTGAVPVTTTYTLDGNGQPTGHTTGDGVAVTYTYDRLSRLASIGGPGLAIAYAYDPVGRRVRMSDATGTTTYEYDGLGRITAMAAPSATLGYGYDRDGNRTRLSYPGNQVVNYTFTPGGRLATVTDWASRTSTYTYQSSGLVSTLTYPNAVVASYVYDFAQRLTQLTYRRGTVMALERYTLDADGNRTSINDLVGTTPEVTGTLRYDGLERLVSFERHLVANGAPVSNETFSFDAASNIVARTGPAATNSYDGANRITSDGTRSFSWDAADRLRARGADTFTYDALGRMSGSVVGGIARTYAYDGDGLLRSRSQGSATTAFLHDSSVAPAPLLVAGTDRVVHGLGPVYRVHADGSYDTFVRDGLGSIRLEVSGTGAITSAFDYTAYGAINTSTAQPLLGFTGELTDPSGLIYLRARWYDPGVGRFTTRDPFIGTPQRPPTQNGFTYASCRPSVLADPLGLDPNDPCSGKNENAIRVVANEIKRRILDLKLGPKPPLSGTIAGHVEKIENKSAQLSKLLLSWDKGRCGNSPVIADAREVLSYPIPFRDYSPWPPETTEIDAGVVTAGGVIIAAGAGGFIIASGGFGGLGFGFGLGGGGGIEEFAD
jgi:RHS repeat-associated protein